MLYPGLTPRIELSDPWAFACHWRALGFAVWDDPICRCVRVSSSATVYRGDGEPIRLTGAQYNTLWGEWSI